MNSLRRIFRYAYPHLLLWICLACPIRHSDANRLPIEIFRENFSSGVRLSGRGDHKNAIESFKTAALWASQEDVRTVHDYITGVYTKWTEMEPGTPEQRREILDQQKAWELLTQGYDAYLIKDYDSAMEKFEQSVQSDKDLLEAYKWLGCVAVEAGMTAKAKAAFRELLRRKPDLELMGKVSAEAHTLFDAQTDVTDIIEAEGFSVRISKDGAEMVLIPAGEFQMGSDDGDSDEQPVHTVYVDAFYMDKYEVINAQYKKFMNATGHKAPKYWNKSKYNAPTHPVVGVSWNDAVAYAKWAGKRLPTEAGWEKAARGGLRGKKYPRGDEITHDDANYEDADGKDKWTETSPVGSFAPNGYGLYDMTGNVLEWCADWYDKDYYSSSSKRTVLSSTNSRVLRGGLWGSNPIGLRVANRYYSTPTGTYSGVGFRCVSRTVHHDGYTDFVSFVINTSKYGANQSLVAMQLGSPVLGPLGLELTAFSVTFKSHYSFLPLGVYYPIFVVEEPGLWDGSVLNLVGRANFLSYRGEISGTNSYPLFFDACLEWRGPLHVFSLGYRYQTKPYSYTHDGLVQELNESGVFLNIRVGLSAVLLQM